MVSLPHGISSMTPLALILTGLGSIALLLVLILWRGCIPSWHCWVSRWRWRC
ncbi:hypothetical protein RAA17_00820 [Komagataeibacter rhaeticus]|nr:hypothetical protein [Komagataeibacter rhaeticus]